MKKLFFVGFILILFLLGCGKEKKPKEDLTYTGTSSALKNGVIWNAKARFAIIRDSLSISLNIFNGQNFLRESLGFNNIPIKQGTFILKKIIDHQNVTTAFVTLQDDGDVKCDNFTLDDLRTNNIIKITNLDTLAKTIRCEFNGTYFINNIGGGKCNPNEVDTVKYTNGIIQGSY